MVILVTGSNGMIGFKLVDALLEDGNTVIGIDKTKNKRSTNNYFHYQIDLDDSRALYKVIHENQTDRIIHLAALAHTNGESDLTWDHYYHVNVECARNVFESACNIPVLFISTIDVYGFYDGKDEVTADTPIHPVSNYGKSKAEAESECKKISHYDIFRFSPVYTDDIKRDIQKRYYLKYPNIAYQIGKGSYYEILNVSKAVSEIVKWCHTEPSNSIRIIKEDSPMWTPAYIKTEKEAGRAKIVLKVPRWILNFGYNFFMFIVGENQLTYLLNKLIHPIKSH